MVDLLLTQALADKSVHGDKFKLNDETSWWTPDQVLEVLDPKIGQLCLRLWCNLHGQQSAKTNMFVIQVERLSEALKGKARPLWLVWVGEGRPELSTIWRHYLRRFAIDHWYRFAIASLHWTLPKLSTTEQCERWSDSNATAYLATMVGSRSSH